MSRSPQTADTRAAPAALERLPSPEIVIDRVLVIDDSNEATTRIVIVATRRRREEMLP
jgi:hypothetical protein